MRPHQMIELVTSLRARTDLEDTTIHAILTDMEIRDYMHSMGCLDNDTNKALRAMEQSGYMDKTNAMINSAFKCAPAA